MLVNGATPGCGMSLRGIRTASTSTKVAEPGVMTNVENGFGFVGSGYKLTHEMLPPECLLSWAGYAFTFNPCTRADFCTYTGAQCG